MASNAECTARLAAVGLRCAGLRLLTVEQMAMGDDKRQRLVDAGDVAGLKEMVADLDAVLHRAPVMSADPTLYEVNDAVVRLLFSRKGCGADLKPQISTAPFDGQTRTGICPECGAVFKFTPPLSDEEAGQVEARRQAALAAAIV